LTKAICINFLRRIEGVTLFDI